MVELVLHQDPSALANGLLLEEHSRLNGMDLRAHLLEERPGIKLIMMSGADMNEIVRQNINLPFLPKPFDGEALLARVRTILESPMESLISLPPLSAAARA